MGSNRLRELYDGLVSFIPILRRGATCSYSIRPVYIQSGTKQSFHVQRPFPLCRYIAVLSAMPGLGAPVSLEWCRTSDPATSASTPGRPIMNRSSLPPLTTPSLASHRSAAGQARLKAVPTWTPRRSSPPSTTYRSYSPIPSFSPGQLSSRPEQDLDAFATWAHAPHHSHHASPTSNDSSDDLFHMSRNSALKHRSPEPSFSVTTKSVFSPSSDFLMSSDEEAGNGSLSDSRRRKDLQSQHGTVEIDSEGSSSSQDHEQAKLLGQRSALSPPYHAGPSPHYRATEPALADHGYTEAIRIANADFDHWQRLSTSVSRHVIQRRSRT